jgi:probable HAF family extracellular repeat protein
MARHLLKKRLMWGMLIAIAMVIAIVGSTLEGSVSAATTTTKFPYIVEELGTLGGTESTAYSINEAGQVVGASTTTISSILPHAVLWNKDKKIDLGALTIHSGSSAQAINNAGKVVGASQTRNSASTRHAVLWNKGNIIDFETLDATDSRAYDINNADQVVGSAAINFNQAQLPVLWDKGNKIDLGTLGGGYGVAEGINNAGKVVGYSTNSQHVVHAVLWDKGNKVDLGVLGGSPYNHNNNGSLAYDINNADQVVGKSNFKISPVYHAVLWEKGNIKDLGTLGNLGTNRGNFTISTALGINDAGKVVGFSETDKGVRFAVLWDENSIKNLNRLIPPRSGFVLQSAEGINNRGQIIANGQIVSKGGVVTHRKRAFLLTPVK